MISPATSAALRSRVAEARAVRLARQFARRRVPVRPVSDLAAHAGAVFDNPLDNTANTTFADHLLETHPDDPAAEAFRQFLMEGQPLASMAPHIAGSLWRGVGPHERARVPYYEVRMVTGGRNRSIHADLTPEAMSTPSYRRLHGGKWWFPLRYVERPGNQAIDADSTRPLRGGGRGRGLTSGEVAQHVYETGGVNSLLHAIIAARYFHPERTETPPHAPREGTQYRFARAVRRYAASESDLHTIFQQIHPSVWHGETRHDTLPREVAADALDDLDRPAEAQLMRTRLGPDPADRSKPMLPVYLDNGTVRPVAALRTELTDGGDRMSHSNRANLTTFHPEDRDYLNAALWSSTDTSGPEEGHEDPPLDRDHTIGDIHPATLAQMVADNRLFHSLHGHLIGDATDRSGHDFWLTRNGHGTGFRDHDDEYAGQSHELEDAAHRFGEYDLTVGDDGMIHGQTYGHHEESPDMRDEGMGPDDPPYTGGMRGAHYARAAAAARRYAAMSETVSPDDLRAWHAKMHADLAENTQHLVYADMLEESGHPRKAAIIRYSVEHPDRLRGRAEPTDYRYPHAAEPGEDQPPKPGEFRARWHNLAQLGRGEELVTLEQRSVADPSRLFTWHMDVPRGEGRKVVDAVDEESTPTEPTHLARHYAAYRSPAGSGVVVRGTFYPPGKMIPDLKKFLPPEKLDRLKARARTRKKKVVESRAQTYQRVRRYAMEGDPTEHAAFHRAINKNPTDATTRSVYADFLDERDPAAADPETVAFLRTHQGSAWVGRDPGTGKVVAGRRWTMAEIRQAMTEAGSHWFDRDTMRFFGTRLLPREVYHGPGGIYFIHEGDNFDRTQRQFRIAGYEPEDHRTFSPGSRYDAPIAGEVYDDLAGARHASKAFAAGKAMKTPFYQSSIDRGAAGSHIAGGRPV